MDKPSPAPAPAMDTARGIEGGSDNAPFAQQSVRSPSSPERTAPMWLAAAFFVATLAPGAQARDLAGASRSGDTSRLAQAQRTNPAETNPAELQAGSEQEQPRAKVMARDLAAAQRDLISVLTLLQQEREHAALLEQDLASARRDVETQVVLAGKASDEVTKFKQAEKGPAELRQSLQKEQEKAEMLAQELSMARARIYAFEAQAREFSDQAAELKQAAEGSAADLRTSPQQERETRLEQDVAAARRDLEKQMALAAKAGEEARQMKHAADSRAELQKSVEQGQERTARLEQDVAAAPRDLEKQTARPAKASRQASQTKRRAESSAAGWFNSNSIWNLIFAPQRR